MANNTLSNLYTQAFRTNWEQMAFTDYEGKDFTGILKWQKSSSHFICFINWLVYKEVTRLLFWEEIQPTGVQFFSQQFRQVL